MKLLFKDSIQQDKLNSFQILDLEGFAVPIHIYIEKRRNSRVSLLKDKINIRLPKFLNQGQRDKEVKQLLSWAEKRINKKSLYSKALVHSKNYREEKAITINDENWELVFVENPNLKTFSAKTDPINLKILISGPFQVVSLDRKNEITIDLMKKVFINHYKAAIINLVSKINDKTFGFDFNTVRLKYLTSRWGSCSKKGNINLSLRLLLAPKEVMHYVIIHELAHLQEMNHSAKFWSLVASVMPNYKTYEKWLKTNGRHCDF